MRTIFLLLLAFSSLATAADTMTVDGIHKEHRPITVNHDPKDVIAVLFWKDGMAMQLGEDHFDREIEGRTVFVAPPGIYIVTIRGSQIITVTPDNDKVLPDPPPKPKPDPNPVPPPGPDPIPDPVPDPEPDREKLAVKGIYFFEEQMDRGSNPEQTAVMTDPDFRSRMRQRNVPVVLLDKDLESAKAWSSKIQTLPSVLFYESQDKWKIEPVPMTVDAMNQLVEKVMK